MCDMLDVVLKYSSPSLYSKSLFFDAQPGGSPACKEFQSVVNLTILLDRAASVSASGKLKRDYLMAQITVRVLDGMISFRGEDIKLI